MKNLTKHQYNQTPDNFLDGFDHVFRGQLSRLATESQKLAMAQRQARVASAAEFFGDLLTGSIPAYYLQEALRPSAPEFAQRIDANYPGLFRRASARETMGWGVEAQTTSDFPLLVGDVLDRMLLDRFNEIPPVWRDYISVGRPLRDFRDARLIATDGGDGEWPKITEEEGITYTNITESGFVITPDLYGKATRISWRLERNDDLNAFLAVPDVLGRGGRRTISRFATDLLFDSNGPDATFISAGNGNLITGNPVLSIASLGTAIEQFATFVDSEGEPILQQGMRLVHGPALRVTVQNILNQLTVDITEAGGTSARTVRVSNWIVSGLTAVEDPYIPIIATSNGNTSWLLVADPNISRPAARIRFYAGFEEPNLYMKAPNTSLVQGGLDASVGDFSSMSKEFKGLVAFGGTTIEPKAVVGSNGSGS